MTLLILFSGMKMLSVPNRWFDPRLVICENGWYQGLGQLNSKALLNMICDGVVFATDVTGVRAFCCYVMRKMIFFSVCTLTENCILILIQHFRINGARYFVNFIEDIRHEAFSYLLKTIRNMKIVVKTENMVGIGEYSR